MRLSALVSRWKQHGNIPRIERDLALDELREIYDALLNVDDGRVAPESLPAPQQVSEQPARPEPKPAPKSQPEPQPVVERVAEPEPQMEHTADPWLTSTMRSILMLYSELVMRSLRVSQNQKRNKQWRRVVCH